MEDKLVVYHCHSHYSLLDSCTDFKAYVDRAVELGQPAIAFSEHGKPLDWTKKKLYCDEKGIKYMHAVECYLTEQLEPKVRDNYHTILIAKNASGVRELNRAISMSTDEAHTYFVNRLSFDEFLCLSNNIIKISACLASPLNKLPQDHKRFEELVLAYDFLEVQAHDHPEQKAYNMQLEELSRKYKKPLIAGTDTHSLDAYKAECRDILLKAKGRSYGDEDSFDLTFKCRAELESAFAAQGVLPEKIYSKAIDNTVALANMVEPFELDTSIKYPILYGSKEADDNAFSSYIESCFSDKIANGIIPMCEKEAFENAIEEEKRVFHKTGMSGFMLCEAELIKYCHDNNIPVGPARGSVAGSRVAYVTDIIDLNPERWHTVFSRFCNEDRVEIGDIDIDCIESDRPKIFRYITERFGQSKTARIASYGTIQSKGTIREICRALHNKLLKENGDGAKSPYTPDGAEIIVAKFEDDESVARELFPDVFYYYDGLLGTIISQSIHPAGIVISPVELESEYGVFQKDGERCMMINMDDIHDVGLAKFDFLVLTNVQIIRDTCQLAGIPYPKSHEVNFDDEDVWDDMIQNPTGIFQFESKQSMAMLRKFKPKSIFDMSLVTAAIRPSGASYRDRLIDRLPNQNPSEQIDALLSDNNGYLVYQCDIIKFLQQICGLSGSEADTVRRGIARKKPEILEKALPRILDGYCKNSSHPREVAEQEAKEFLRIIEDASEYMFGYNHSIAYCIIGYYCAYLRKYYPYEFLTSLLNNAKTEEDIANGTELANHLGITINPPLFGESAADYAFNREEKSVSKGIASVKYLNKKISNELYSAAHSKEHKTFVDVLRTAKNVGLDARQTDILIKIGFFRKYGNIRELLRITEIFDWLKNGEAKQIRKAEQYAIPVEIIEANCCGTTSAGKEASSWRIQDMDSLLRDAEQHILSIGIGDFTLKEQVDAQLEYLGYIGVRTNNQKDRRNLAVLETRPLRSKKTGKVWGYSFTTKSLGTGKVAQLTVQKWLYDFRPVKPGDLIYAETVKEDRGFWHLTSYTKGVI